MNTDTGVTKQSLRAEMRAQRAALTADFVESAARAIADRTRALLVELGAPSAILAYAGGRENEVPTLDLLDALRAEGTAVYLPVVMSRTELQWRPYSGRESLAPGAFGIPEPLESLGNAAPPVHAPVVMPGLVFDLAGNRIGFGVGHYDRFLAGHNGVRIALAYDFQVLAAIPSEPHDIRVNWIVTESRCIACGR